MVVTVRTATVDDGMAIGRIHVESWQAAYAGVVPQAHLDGLDPEERGRNWRDAIEANPEPDHGCRLVADHGGRVVGFAIVVPDRDGEERVGEIPVIYVEPDAWGMGAGYALMTACEAEFRRRRFVEAVLWVLEDNPRARRFYERQGWFVDGGRKEEDIGGVVLGEVRYRRRLAQAD